MPRIPRKSAGVNTGLGVNECWVALFEENEKRHRLGGKPLPRTNAQLTTFMVQEFPGKDSEVYRQVNKVIWRYNNAKLYLGQPKPYRKTYRYDSKGNRVDPRFFDPETD